MELSETELKELEENKIITFYDIHNMTYKKINELNMQEKLKAKIVKVFNHALTINKPFKKNDIEITTKNVEYIESLKIKYRTGQKMISSGICSIKDLTEKTMSEVKDLCNLTDREIESVQKGLNELGFEFKKDKQLKK